MKYKIKFFPTKTMSVGLALVMIVSCFWSNADTIVLATTSSYETDTILCENDYSTANKAVTPDINGHTSGDMLPATDPLDTTNTVMHYKQSWYAKGVLFLGAEYESANASKIPSLVRDKTIQVKENVTYEIEYDYYS